MSDVNFREAMNGRSVYSAGSKPAQIILAQLFLYSLSTVVRF
jgi:hypothetical protein